MSALIRATIESLTRRLRQQERKTGAPAEKTGEAVVDILASPAPTRLVQFLAGH